MSGPVLRDRGCTTRMLVPLLLAAALATPCVADAQGAPPPAYTTDVARKAAAMKDDIQHAYEQMKAAGTLTGSLHGNDITAVVERHISTGSRLSEAEALLRQDGFEVSDKQASGAPGIYASSKSIARSTAFGASNDVVVELGSDGAADQPKVSSVSAHIYATTL